MKKLSKANIQKFFDSDRAILLACIFISLIFWLLVKLSQSFTTSEVFDIHYQLPVGKSFVESPPNQVTAVLEGSGWDLISHQFDSNENRIRFEINNVESQALNAGLVKAKVQNAIATTLKVTEVDTDFIFVQMESETEKKVPVIINHRINLTPQFQFADSLRIEPNQIILTGPATEVDKIDSIFTELIDLNDVSKSQNIEISLKAPNNKEIHLSQEKVILQMEVEQFTEQSLFIPITIKNAPDSLKTFPDKVRLNCIVGLSRFSDVTASTFELAVDLKDIPLNTEKNTIPVLVSKQPDFVRGVNFQPKSVEFFFVETQQDTSQVEELEEEQ